MKKQSFVIVSNRLPVSVSKTDGKLEFHVSTGGLATAMSSLDNGDEQIWVGWPGIASDDLTASDKVQITRELRKYNCMPVYLTEEQVQNFYEGYSNDTLWPLFHYFQSFTKHNADYWRAYQDVNKLFMKAVKSCSTDTAKVWIQDYHLMLLPAMLRKSMPNTLIGFFLHIPFPAHEIFRLVPERRALLEGLLGADLLGFHIYDYARYFVNSCVRVLGVTSHQSTIYYEGRTIKVDAYPIGIDYKKFRSTLKSHTTKEAINVLKETYEGQKIILSVDRLDYSKGIPERLEAFDQFLHDNPKYIGKVKLVMIAVPSRTEVETYKNLRDNIEQTVSRINGTYGTVDWAPISYQFQNLPFENIVALYSASHVALVTPLRDGMNLVAKEYLASKTMNSPGVLILSEMAGAIDELPEALRINPNNTKAVSLAIKQALSMPKVEKSSRLKSMQQRISRYTVQRWGSDFIADLEAIKSERNDESKSYLGSVKIKEIVEDFENAKSRLLLLDYDGTLQSFKASHRASAAKPGKKLLSILNTIAEKPDTEVCIVSGRNKRSLESWFGKTKLTLIAEHGAWVKQNGHWQQRAELFDEAKLKIYPTIEKYVARTAGSTLEEKDFSLVWHYRNVPTELAFARTSDLRRELNALVEGTDIGIFQGHKIIEVKPKSVHKGSAAAEYGKPHAKGFILCAGDDYTDEDMFEALPESANTIKVGPGETVAKYRITNVDKMISMLDKIAKSK